MEVGCLLLTGPWKNEEKNESFAQRSISKTKIKTSLLLIDPSVNQEKSLYLTSPGVVSVEGFVAVGVEVVAELVGDGEGLGVDEALDVRHDRAGRLAGVRRIHIKLYDDLVWTRSHAHTQRISVETFHYSFTVVLEEVLAQDRRGNTNFSSAFSTEDSKFVSQESKYFV